MADDVLLNKIAIIERCLKRVKEDYAGHEDDFDEDFMRQDAVILNLQRACEAAIDVAMHVVREKKLGLPQESREVFQLLSQAGLISDVLKQRMQAMVGFRNIAVHDYQQLNLDIIKKIIDAHLSDFRDFIAALKPLI